MLAVPVEALPEGPGWAYEPKFDGWRALAFRREHSVHLQSRTGKPLGGYFPDVTRMVRASLPAGVVLDGELVVWERDRTSFALLQRRRSGRREVVRVAPQAPTHPAGVDLPRDAGQRGALDTPPAAPPKPAA